MYTFARHVLTGHFIYLFIYIVKKEKKRKNELLQIPPAFFVLFAFLFIMYSMGC